MTRKLIEARYVIQQFRNMGATDSQVAMETERLLNEPMYRSEWYTILRGEKL